MLFIHRFPDIIIHCYILTVLLDIISKIPVTYIISVFLRILKYCSRENGIHYLSVIFSYHIEIIYTLSIFRKYSLIYSRFNHLESNITCFILTSGISSGNLRLIIKIICGISNYYFSVFFMTFHLIIKAHAVIYRKINNSLPQRCVIGFALKI